MLRPADHRGHVDTGTVLLLFPAAVLIMFLLGAIVVDVGLTQLRARELDAVAASAANDALAALDVAALRSGEGFVIHEDDVFSVATASVAAGPLPEAVVAEVAVTRDPQNRIVIAVTLALHVELVMAPGIGGLDQITLRRTERAVILGSDRP